MLTESEFTKVQDETERVSNHILKHQLKVYGITVDHMPGEEFDL